MTSDAKIGLLLGLVFIFVIAFIINGLPGLHHTDDGNKLTTNMVGLQDNPSGLGASERKVALETAAGNAVPAETSAGATDTRFTMALPQNAPDVTGAAPVVQGADEPVAVQPAETGAPVASIQPATANPARIVSEMKQQPSGQTGPAKPTAPRFYVVEDGDSLSSIANKVYGPQQGNKLANINALFESNRKTLASADEIQVGQKLIVPPLAGSAAPAPAAAGVLSGKDFKKVDSVGKRYLPAGADKPAPAAKSNLPAKSSVVYVVQDGDSLWRIAAARLGDGNRYKEIVKLNSDVLTNEDALEVGMQLKMPAR